MKGDDGKQEWNNPKTYKLNNIYNRNTNVKSSQSFTQTYDGGKAMGEEMSWYVQTNRWGMHIPVTSKKL